MDAGLPELLESLAVYYSASFPAQADGPITIMIHHGCYRGHLSGADAVSAPGRHFIVCRIRRSCSMRRIRNENGGEDLRDHIPGRKRITSSTLRKLDLSHSSHTHAIVGLKLAEATRPALSISAGNHRSDVLQECCTGGNSGDQ